MIADTDCVAYRMDIEVFLAAMETHYELAMGLVRLLARTMIQLGEPANESSATHHKAIEGNAR